MAYRDYGVANGFTVNPNGQGDFTTITAALAVAVSGNTIYLYPGTYTENFTLPVGVNLTALGNCSLTPTVIINGTITFSAAGTSTITGCMLQTNGATALTFSGSGVSELFLDQCFINCVNNTGISFTNSNAGSFLQLYRTNADTGTTGISIYTMSAVGTLQTIGCYFANSSTNRTASSNSAGRVIHHSLISNQNFSASAGTINFNSSNCNMQTTAGVSNSQTVLTLTGTAIGGVSNSILEALNATTITVGAGATIAVAASELGSDATYIIQGSGTAVLESISARNKTGISVSLRGLSGSLMSPNFILIGPTGTMELQGNTTLQIDSGALVDIQSGAKLQVDAGAEVDFPLSGLLVGNSAGFAVTSIPLTSNGQLAIGGAGGPMAATLTAGTGVTITNAANAITISASSAGFTWNNVTGGSATLAAENGYFANAAGLTTFTLPSIVSSNFGDTIKIIGLGAGGWTITQLALEQINVSGDSTTSGIGGSISSTNSGDCIELVYSPTSGLWIAESFIGNLSIT